MKLTAPKKTSATKKLLWCLLGGIGLLPRKVRRPIVGSKAHVRFWQRVLSLVVLFMLVIGLGIVIAILVGAIVVALAFLLENAIS